MEWVTVTSAMQSDIVQSFPTATDGSTTLARALEEVSKLTGFVPDPDAGVAKRTVYMPDKVWRIRIEGKWRDEPATLRLESRRLPIEEEMMRLAFRFQVREACNDTMRPPETYAWQPFDPNKGYGWSLDEAGGDKILFDPAGDPKKAVARFIDFHHLLHGAVVKRPFWYCDVPDAGELSRAQADKWLDVSKSMPHSGIHRCAKLLEHLRTVFIEAQRRMPTQFMHAHLSGADVRLKQRRTGGPVYLVFANHHWSWRQPGYGVAFPIWGMWLARPLAERTPEGIAAVTEAWLAHCPSGGDRLQDRRQVMLMLLNRCYGSLLLDIPAKRAYEPAEAVDALEASIAAEAERLLREVSKGNYRG